MLGQNVIFVMEHSIFHDFSITFEIFKDFHDFFRPKNQSLKSVIL